MNMSIIDIVWQTDGAMLFGVGRSSQGQVLYRLVVERLPGGVGWDWSVWRTDDLAAAISHGTAPSSGDAMADAEAAARAWDAANDP
jgi:hypothetical protein